MTAGHWAIAILIACAVLAALMLWFFGERAPLMDDPSELDCVVPPRTEVPYEMVDVPLNWRRRAPNDWS